MFKFRFFSDQDDDSDETTTNPTTTTTINWLESKEIRINPNEINCYDRVEEIQIENVVIKYYLIDEIIEKIKHKTNDNSSILNAEQNHSDLITGVYEGGSKIWECTYDLLNYLTKNRVNFKDSYVLDLGCGAGILGIFTLLNGATCCFQDYNVEVLKNITIPNVFLNCKKSETSFYSGDWGSFLQLLETSNDKFDYILTSETIYNPENYQKLHDTFKVLLKPTGTIYLAAKQYYFGVGGNIAEFLEIINNNRTFTSSICWECSIGVKRSIIKLNFK